MWNEEAAEMPCEADWAEAAIDTDAVVPKHETAGMLKDLMLLFEDANAYEIVISNDDDDDHMKQWCGCAQCKAAIQEFYPDYLAFVKRLSASGVDQKTRSIRRTI
jgi:predicted metal-dependent phosphotriesterase family hydrolase